MEGFCSVRGLKCLVNKGDLNIQRKNLELCQGLTIKHNNKLKNLRD